MTVHRFLLTSLTLSSLAVIAPASVLAATASSAVTVNQSQQADWMPARGGTLDQTAYVDTSVMIDGQVAGRAKTDAAQHIWSFGPLHQQQTVADGVKVDWNNNQWPSAASVQTAFQTDQEQHGQFKQGTQGDQHTISWSNSNIGSTQAKANVDAHQVLISDAAQSQQTQGQTHVDGWFNPPMPSGHNSWFGNIMQNVNVFVQNTINW